MSKTPKIGLLDCVKPNEGEVGMSYSVICQNGKCQFSDEVWVSRCKERPTNGIVAMCPACGCAMKWNPAGSRILVNSRGPGVSETKYGQKRKRELISRNERLRATQWEKHEPLKVPEGSRPVNPTKGGPYDPSSKFSKKRRKPKIYLSK